MRKYKHIFFDLDRTLWDFEKNSEATFNDLYLIYNIEEILGCKFTEFFNNYKIHNIALWELYRKGEIKKDFLSLNRFLYTLNDFGNNNLALAQNLAKDYIAISPQKNLLFPHTIETLDFLKDKYQLHIITNGFIEVQYKKIKNSGLEKYFSNTITSEEAGVQKPAKHIFDYSLQKANAMPNESIMIGDDLQTDILGAKNAGIDQIFFNIDNISHNEEITHEIDSLIKIIDILN